MQTVQVLTKFQRSWAVALFWPLWWLTAALQVLDAGTIWLNGARAGHRIIHEVNPVMTFLDAHYGPLGVMLVKLWGVATWLVLVAGLYVLALRMRSRFLAAVCLGVIAVGALYSAALFWNNAATVLGF